MVSANVSITTGSFGNHPLPPTLAELDLEWFEDDIEDARRKKREIQFRFLDSIRPANQPRTLRPTAAIPRGTLAMGRNLGPRGTAFRRVARPRPGHRGRIDGKRRRSQTRSNGW